jgi:hypothetical protein
MTTRGRLNARLDPELERKLSYLRRRTGLGTSEIVRTSIERYYAQTCSEAADARSILEASGFIGGGTGPTDLSQRSKEHLLESLESKHS